MILTQPHRHEWIGDDTDEDGTRCADCGARPYAEPDDQDDRGDGI